MNAEQLQAVRADDARLGEGDEGLQMWPAVYTQRRWLLKALDAREADTKTLTGELSQFFGPIGGGTTDLADLVQRLRATQQLRTEIEQAMTTGFVRVPAEVKPPSECGWCRFEEADGELIEQCAKCREKDNPLPTRLTNIADVQKIAAHFGIGDQWQAERVGQFHDALRVPAKFISAVNEVVQQLRMVGYRVDVLPFVPAPAAPPQRTETGHPMLCGCAECM